MNLDKYQTLVFDCDGVLLNSNKVKTQAFYNVALPYGKQVAQALVDYHVKNGGISRYKKLELFLNELMPKGISKPSLEDLLAIYAQEVRQKLLACEVARGLKQLREKALNSNWLIVSGSDQNELRGIFAERGLAELFEGGIFGSPNSKDQILDRELKKGNIKRPALFLGDSKYDYQAATNAGIDFVFLSGWSEVKDWLLFCSDRQVLHFDHLSSLTIAQK